MARDDIPTAGKSPSSKMSSENSSGAFDGVANFDTSLLRRLDVFIAGLTESLSADSGLIAGNRDAGILGFSSACLIVPADDSQSHGESRNTINGRVFFRTNIIAHNIARDILI